MISIIDYGAGNLKSVQKAFAHIGCDTVVASQPSRILSSDAVVLPGVGAFADAMKALRDRGLDEIVKQVVYDGMPFLGICLGLQLLFEYSEEGGGKEKGLGIFKGCIKYINVPDDLKVPHMGWNCLDIKKESPLFNNMEEKPFVYFVHSYCLHSEDRNIVAATCTYGETFDAAISEKNVCAVQFHPEKSGQTGINILKNWLKNVAGVIK